jgi:hypothetical protein
MRNLVDVPGHHKRRAALACAAGLVAAAMALPVPGVRAVEDATAVDVRAVDHAGGDPAPRPTASQRLAWEVRKRTSVETRLSPTRVRLDDTSIFETPLLYWSGSEGFEPLSEGEVRGLRRFVELGGFVLIDDAAPERSAFDASVRRELGRALPASPLAPLPATHTVFRSFYLVSRPVGRTRGPDHLEGIDRGGRTAVVYSRHDLGGALARDNLGSHLHVVHPGGESQREMAVRLAVNLVMYALCLDYKDDQVHAPFIMRRRGGPP